MLELQRCVGTDRTQQGVGGGGGGVGYCRLPSGVARGARGGIKKKKKALRAIITERWATPGAVLKEC